MTMVGTTPPPRLPIRDKVARHRTGGVSPMLTRLAAEHATGVLVRASGTLYLAEGRVVHAESPYAPGLDILLTAHGTLDARDWQDAVERADEPRGADRALLDGGRLAPGALELCHLSALYDAAYFALAPSSTPGRFRYGPTHWLGSVHPVPVGSVEQETLRRRALLHRIWPDPATDSAPLERLDTAAAPAVPPRQSAVLARVDGLRTATDIARDLGRPAFHTLVSIRRLAAAGLVAPRTRPPGAKGRPRPAHAAPAAPTGTEHPVPDDPGALGHPAADDPAALGHAAPVPPVGPAPADALTPRTPGGTLPGTSLGPGTLDHPDIALLKRVRDALEAL
ncbi:transcriptional regulator [Streptomyces sp. NPDC089424]|uniref:transcriptional regulator n=1 Tax=Streptomyces sp. NPDC089424 TaxID=3365917 RepID=UPI0037F1BD23